MPAPTHVTVSPRSFACDLADLRAYPWQASSPASLFRYQPASGQGWYGAMAVAWHALLAPRGVTVRVLKACPVTGAVLVYVYPHPGGCHLAARRRAGLSAKRGLHPRQC